MRKFNHYKKELVITAFNNQEVLKRHTKGNDAKKVQEWIELNRLKYPQLKSIVIDSDFGKATELAVKEFQGFKGIKSTGEVDIATFSELTKSMTNAFEPSIDSRNFREVLLQVGQLHKDNFAFELKCKKMKHSEVENNLGPWVRSYCNGIDGESYWWCCGFVKTIFDIACDISGVNFKDVFVDTLSCDVAAEFAIDKGRLIRNNDLKKRIKEIKPGDVFFKYSPDDGNAWKHIGIIKTIDNNSGIITTIEGNSSTSKDGPIADTNNGVQVNNKIRDLLFTKQSVSRTGKKYHDYYEVYSLNI